MHLRRHGTFRLGMDVIFPGHLPGHDDSLPPLAVSGRMKSCHGPARTRGINGAQATGVLGESGGTIMMHVTSRSSGNGHAGTECHTGTMGAGAPPAVRSERNGIQPAGCAVFVGPTDRK